MSCGEPAWWHEMIGLNKDPLQDMTKAEMKSIFDRIEPIEPFENAEAEKLMQQLVDVQKEVARATALPPELMANGVSKEYVDYQLGDVVLNNSNGDMYAYDGVDWSEMTISAAPTQFEGQLQLNADGILWYDADGNKIEVTNELVALRREVDYLKGVLSEIAGPYVVKEFDLNGVSLVKDGGHPIQESEESKFDRAMKGID